MKGLTIASWLMLALAAPARANAPAAKPVTVAFDLLSTKHMIVDVKINGKGPFTVVFDTGAPVTLINNKTAKAAEVFPKDYKAPPFALFGATPQQFKMKTLEVGDLKAENVPTMVMDHPTVSMMAKILKKPIEGIVGFTFFARYKVTLDYQAKTMIFVPNGFDPPDAMKGLMEWAMNPKKKPPKKVLAPAAQWGFSVAKASGDEDAGITVKEVLEGSAAAAAGLKTGDRLLTLDHRWTDSVTDCYTAASHVPPGTTARATIKRGDKEMELTIKPRPGL